MRREMFLQQQTLPGVCFRIDREDLWIAPPLSNISEANVREDNGKLWLF